MNALTWNGQIGTIVKDGKFYELDKKPELGFLYGYLYFEPEFDNLVKDGEYLTGEEIIAIKKYIASFSPITPEKTFTYTPTRDEALRTMLFMTDWFIIREIEQGIACPESIKQRRAWAREQLTAFPLMETMLSSVEHEDVLNAIMGDKK